MINSEIGPLDTTEKNNLVSFSLSFMYSNLNLNELNELKGN